MKGPCKEYGQQLCGCDQCVLGSQRGKLQADNDLKKIQRPHSRTDTRSQVPGPPYDVSAWSSCLATPLSMAHPWREARSQEPRTNEG